MTAAPLNAARSLAGGLVAPGFAAVYVAGFAVSGFFALDDWRAALLGTHTVAPWAPLLLLATASLLAWVTLAGRRALWMSPAELTWSHVGDRRMQVLRRRLLVAWSWRVGVLTYVWTMAAAVAAVPELVWLIGSAAGAVVAVGVLVVLGPARAARALGRRELVAGWHRHTVRSSAIQFLDPMLLLDAARPVGLALAGAALLRWSTAETAGRWPALLMALVVLGVAVAVLHAAPALPAVAVLGGLGYLSLVPAAGGLGRLWRHPALGRWIGSGAVAVRVAAAAVLTVPVLAWCALALPFGAPTTALLVVPVIVAAIIRTVTRPQPRYDTGSAVVLILWTLRGVDLLVAGCVVLLAAADPVSTAIALAVIVVVGVLR